MFSATVKEYVAFSIYCFNKPHSLITGLTYISNTQPQNTGLAYMRYVITPEYRVSIAMRYNLHHANPNEVKTREREGGYPYYPKRVLCHL